MLARRSYLVSSSEFCVSEKRLSNQWHLNGEASFPHLLIKFRLATFGTRSLCSWDSHKHSHTVADAVKSVVQLIKKKQLSHCISKYHNLSLSTARWLWIVPDTWFCFCYHTCRGWAALILTGDVKTYYTTDGSEQVIIRIIAASFHPRIIITQHITQLL